MTIWNSPLVYLYFYSIYRKCYGLETHLLFSFFNNGCVMFHVKDPQHLLGWSEYFVFSSKRQTLFILEWYEWCFCNRNVMHSGVVQTQGIHIEHIIRASIILPIVLIHSEHLCTYITEILRMAIRWSLQWTRRASGHGDQTSLSQ